MRAGVARANSFDPIWQSQSPWRESGRRGADEAGPNAGTGLRKLTSR
jgi:hypothetical protein